MATARLARSPGRAVLLGRPSPGLVGLLMDRRLTKLGAVTARERDGETPYTTSNGRELTLSRQPSSAPYGYVQVPGAARWLESDTAKVVRRIYDAYTNGASSAEIASALNAERVPAALGGAWSSSKVLRILNNSTYIGSETLGISDLRWPAMVTRKQWEHAAHIRAKRRGTMSSTGSKARREPGAPYRPAPYGYIAVPGESRWRPSPTAWVVRRIFDAYLRGESHSDIARALNRDDVAAARGGSWSAKRISLILRNSAYQGSTALGIPDRVQWPPIVDQTVWRRTRQRQATAPVERSADQPTQHGGVAGQQRHIVDAGGEQAAETGNITGGNLPSRTREQRVEAARRAHQAVDPLVGGGSELLVRGQTVAQHRGPRGTLHR